jgi:AcrR family transcriptional regulator
MASKPAAVPPTCVRDRLLDAADRLFYAEGVRAVGIDRVLAEAGAAKASLYAHFSNKDELIGEYVRQRVEGSRTAITAYLADVPPADRAFRIFDWLVAWAESADFRGCPMQHLVAEITERDHPARQAIAAQRSWIEGRFREWVRDAGAASPDSVVGALIVLFDGAVAAAEMDGAQRAHEARWAAKQLLRRR